ncbi:MAG: hypothetical protein HC923_05480 [Myxococcales bacterium]|nr:hypothetical protein [Myxococcales bacterium]
MTTGLYGCEPAEAVIRNDLGEPVQIQRMRFQGTLWDETLSDREISRALEVRPGMDQVRFRRFHPEGEPGEPGVPVLDGEPTWFNYKTSESFEVGVGEFHVLILRPGEIVQDFDAPSSFGH